MTVYQFIANGTRFTKLVVMGPAGSTSANGRHGHRLWRCHCDCGNIVTGVRADHLRSGHSKSCGCLAQKQREHTAALDLEDAMSVWGRPNV